MTNGAATTSSEAAVLNGMRFGVEIETVGISKEKAARAIAAVVGGTAAQHNYDGWTVVAADGRRWTAVRDGSLTCGENAEVVTPILSYPQDVDTLQNVIRALAKAGAKVDQSCGIHVHVDGGSLTGNGLVNLIKIVNKQEELICNALGVQERRRGRYCRNVSAEVLARVERLRNPTVQSVRTAWYGYEGHRVDRYDSSRYHGLNLNSFFYRGSIEFRWFEGTLHAGKVRAYVQLCLALVAKAAKTKRTPSARRAFNASTARYDVRVLLLRLGMIGDEFATARLHIAGHLAGSSTFKHGTPSYSRPRRATRQDGPTVVDTAA